MARVTTIMSVSVLIIAALLTCISYLSASPQNRRYKDGDYIPLLANKVYPSSNDHCEAYPYFELPFCPPGSQIPNRTKSWKEILDGDCVTNTRYQLNFKVMKSEETLCEKNLSREEVAKFRDAIYREFEYQMYYDVFELHGEIGKVEREDSNFSKPRYYLVKHINFIAHYSGDQVWRISLDSDFHTAVDISEDAAVQVNFTYSIIWYKLISDLKSPFLSNGTLMETHVGYPGQKVLSVISNMILICFFWRWVAYLVEVTVPYPNRRWTSLRQTHGAGCRCPPYPSLLGAFLGNGSQQFLIFCTLLLLAHQGIRYPCSDYKIVTGILYVYMLTSAVSGYVASAFHDRYAPTGWGECVFQTGYLYFYPAFSTFLFFNALAEYFVGFSVSDFPSARTNWFFLSRWVPCTIVFLCKGAQFGHVIRQGTELPCATRRIPRTVPQPLRGVRTSLHILIGGLLPFIAIRDRMDILYASLWNHRVCGAFSTMMTVWVILIVTTAAIGIMFTQIQFCQEEDLDWWWRSVLRGGSTAIYMFAYGVRFYTRSKRELGFFKILRFLGYNACLFYALFLILGTVGFCASWLTFLCNYRRHLKN